MSEGGEQLLIETLGILPGAESTGSLEGYDQLTRTATGWNPSPLGTPVAEHPSYAIVTVSPDFSDSLWFADVPGRSMSDVYFATAGGPLTLMGPVAPPDDLQAVLEFTGASNDLRHAVFTAQSPQGEESYMLWPGDLTLAGRRPSLYEYTGIGNAEPELVGVRNVGSIDEAAVAEHKEHINEAAELISDCGTALGSITGDRYNAISKTGATVFFTAEACGGSPTTTELYARIDRNKTVAISEPTYPPGQGSGPEPEECDAACATAEHEPGTFAGASEDGSRVFFLTAQPLLNSAATEGGKTDLYEAEIEGEGAGAHIGRIVQVSRDPNPGQAADVQSVARVSEDGSHVYFVAKGVLTSGPRGGEEGECITHLSAPELAEEELTHEGPCRPKSGKNNLYVYERDARFPEGHTAFVATLSPADVRKWQTTPDGGFLVFQSVADLTSDQEGQKEAGQVFEYSAEAETLVRVSQGQNGYNDDGNTSEYAASIPVQEYAIDAPVNRYLRSAVSADGADVVFSSEDALTPQAHSGINNVYEYHAGRVALISDGHDAIRLAEGFATELIGIDESGRDVFFTTADSLVPQDTDTQVDIYDARIYGGFPAPTMPAPCLGDSCQSPPSVAPSLLVPGVSSSTMEAPASNTTPNVKSKTPAKKKAKKHKRGTKTSRGKKKSNGKTKERRATGRAQ
jgi:hypothetical protein